MKPTQGRSVQIEHTGTDLRSANERRIELRADNGPLLGMLVLSPPRLEIKRGIRLFEVDLVESLRLGRAVISEVAPLSRQTDDT